MRCEVREKRFGDAVILKDVAIEIADGEFIAVTGPSGCGKTTLLRILAGLDTDFDGRVESRAPLAVVFQEPRLLPWRTVLENLLLANPAATADEAHAWLTRVGMAGQGGKYPRMLSLGMARRAAIARAMMVNPWLLLLDEPFASLDDELAAGLRAMIAALWRETGFSAMIVTHDLAEARQLAGRVVHLGGKPATIVKVENVGP